MDHTRSTFPISWDTMTYAFYPSSNMSCSLYSKWIPYHVKGRLYFIRGILMIAYRKLKGSSHMLQGRQATHHEVKTKEFPL